MSTATLSTFVRPAKSLHAGVNTVMATFDPANGSTGTLTAASVLKLLKVPNRAVIVDGYIHKQGSAADLTLNLVYQSGTASTTLLAKLCSASASGITRVGIDGAATLDGAIDYQVSISDSLVIRHAVLQAAVASASAGTKATFCLSYTLDGKE